MTVTSLVASHTSKFIKNGLSAFERGEKICYKWYTTLRI